jgi:hypothetical protein
MQLAAKKDRTNRASGNTRHDTETGPSSGEVARIESLAGLRAKLVEWDGSACESNFWLKDDEIREGVSCKDAKHLVNTNRRALIISGGLVNVQIDSDGWPIYSLWNFAGLDPQSRA